MALREIVNGEFADKTVIACDPRLRGFAICHYNGMCRSCAHAKKFRVEHPDAFEVGAV